MDDKLMEEFDIDFISGILGPTELQMADTMIDDLMVEFNANKNLMDSNQNDHNQFADTSMVNEFNNQQMKQNGTINEANTAYNIQNNSIMSQNSMPLYNNSFSEIQLINSNGSNGLMVNQLNEYNTYQINNNEINPVNNVQITNSINSPILVPTAPILVNSNEQVANSHNIQMNFELDNQLHVQNNSHHVHQAQQVASKKVRKNLKDILKDNNAELPTIPTTTTPSISQIYSQNTSINSILSGTTSFNNLLNDNTSLQKNKRRSINSIINGQNNFSMPPNNYALGNPTTINQIQQQHNQHNFQHNQQTLASILNNNTNNNKSQNINSNQQSFNVLLNEQQNQSMPPLMSQHQHQHQPALLLPDIIENKNVVELKPQMREKTSQAELAESGKKTKKEAKMQKKTKASKSSSSNNENEMPSTNEDFQLRESVSNTSKKPPKIPKKTSHNAIEKKYRSSINDKILELKNRVAGQDAKLQKSGILRRALEYITNMEHVNKKLSEENKMLKSALKTISFNINNREIINDTLNKVNLSPYNVEKLLNESSLPNTPPSMSPSDADSLYSPAELNDSSFNLSPQSPQFSISSVSSSSSKSSYFMNEHFSGKSETKSDSIAPKRTYKKAKKETMQDASRIMLCMFVMSVLFFNPFDLIISSNISNDAKDTIVTVRENEYTSNRGFNVRVLNAIDSSFSNEQESNINNESSTPLPNQNGQETFININLLISWILNFLLVLFCLFKLYVNGESNLMNDSVAKNDELVRLHYKSASQKFVEKNYEEALIDCEKGLKELGQSMPKTKFQLLLGITWQLIRLMLDKLYIGVYLSKLGVWYYGLKNMKMYKLCALFYYEMHKFAYLNRKSEMDFLPKATIVETANIQSNGLFASKKLDRTSYTESSCSIYSLLTAFYYMLANYNMIEMYTRFECKESTTIDEYSLCEYYFSIFIFLKFYLPNRISNVLIKYLIKNKLLVKLNQGNNKDESNVKLNNLKKLLKKNLFIQFLINFESYSMCFNRIDSNDQLFYLTKRQKLVNLISYKRRLFSTCYLHDKKRSNEVNHGSVACDFILSKFQDYILLKMTNHIINQSSIVSVDNIVNSASNFVCTDSAAYLSTNIDPIDSDEEQNELADIDQVKFESLKQLYKKNLTFDEDESRNGMHEETQYILVQFLTMLNNWKLRKFNQKVIDARSLEIISKSSQVAKRSYFVDSLVNILKGYELICDKPQDAIENFKKSIESLGKFKNSTSYFCSNNYLIEKFELLIYDYILSAQTYLWTKNKTIQLDLFNETLGKYKSLILNYPELNYKAKMYETIILYLSNRNPIGLFNTTTKQTLFSKCNQEAFLSMNTILKKFQLQLVE